MVTGGRDLKTLHNIFCSGMGSAAEQVYHETLTTVSLARVTVHCHGARVSRTFQESVLMLTMVNSETTSLPQAGNISLGGYLLQWSKISSTPMPSLTALTAEVTITTESKTILSSIRLRTDLASHQYDNPIHEPVYQAHNM
jgi:hypothetical protein